MILMQRNRNPKPYDMLSTKESRVALCVENESKAVSAQGTTTFRIENVKPEVKDKVALWAQIKVRRTKVAFLAKPIYHVQAAIRVSHARLYFRERLVDWDANPNVTSEPYLKLH